MKINSRKFLAWLAWLLLVVASFIFTKQVNDVLVGWFGTVTVIYIGGSWANKMLTSKFILPK